MMLVDSFGRKHDYLRISITDKCNLRCSYCIPFDLPSGYYANSVRMTPEETDQIASAFVNLGIKKIRITGGEPLVRRDAKKIFELLAKHPVELAVTTNGALVHEYIDVFKATGIRSVNVSLDTLQASKFLSITKRDNFEKIISNIHLLLLHNFSVKINVVAMKAVNTDEIGDFVEWTRHFPLQVRFIEFMPFRGNQWEQEKVVNASDILKIISEKHRFFKLDTGVNSTSQDYKVYGYEGSFGVIGSVSEPFCSGCNRLRITADGKLKNCLFSMEETDLLSLLRKGNNINEAIINSVLEKKNRYGGQPSPSLYNLEISNKNSRSMVAIGG